jgi:glycogen synthase
MKIAQVVCVFPPYKSGIGNVAAHFARLAAAAGHAVTVFTPRYRPVAEEQSAAYRVARLRPVSKARECRLTARTHIQSP